MAVFKRYKRKKVKSGTPEYKLATWVCEGMVDGTRYNKSLKSAKTRETALEQEDLIVAKIRVGEFELFKDKTKFTDFVDEIYLPYAKTKNVSYDQKVYETNTLKTFFGKHLLRDITPNLCEKFKQKRLAESVRCQKCKNKLHDKLDCDARKVSPSTVNRELTTLKKLLFVAVDNSKIKDNPMRKVELLTEAPPRDRLLSQTEKVNLLSVIAQNDDFECNSKLLMSIVLIGLTTGWRRGQILSIKRDDLLSDLQAVSVVKSKGQPPRKITVNSVAWNVLSNLAAVVGSKQNKHGFLFFNERTGEQLKNFGKSWHNALRKAGIENLHFHDLRHCFATELLTSGVDSLIVKSALGHSNIKTTAIYAQVTDSLLRDSLGNLDAGNLYGQYVN